MDSAIADRINAAVDTLASRLPSPEGCGCLGRKIRMTANAKAATLRASGRPEEAEALLAEAEAELAAIEERNRVERAEKLERLRRMMLSAQDRAHALMGGSK